MQYVIEDKGPGIDRPMRFADVLLVILFPVFMLGGAVVVAACSVATVIRRRF